MDPNRPTAPVLVIEDNEETRSALRMVLEINGYRAAIARNGVEALSYLRAGNPVSLILLDLRMPVMDGWTFVRTLQGDPQLGHLPVIAFTGTLDQGEVPGAVATIRKSTVNSELFLRLIERSCLRDPAVLH